MTCWIKCNACGHQESMVGGGSISGTCPKCDKSNITLKIGSTPPDWWKDTFATALAKLKGGAS